VTHSTELVFRYDSPAVASVVASSVAVEAGDIEGDRSEAAVDRDGGEVTVTVDASDLTALRAGQNTWLTLVEVAERAAESGLRRRTE
jgi:KEOPS complex subunit Pcc1